MRYPIFATCILALFIFTPTVQAQTSPTAKSAASPLVTDFDGLVKLLNRDSVTHQTDTENQLVLIPTEKGGVDSVFVIRWAAKEGFVHFIHRIPVKVAADRLTEIETAFCRLNHAIAFPGLGVNHETRGIYYRMSIPYQSRGGLRPEEVRSYFSNTLSQGERWRPAITAIADGKATGKTIVEDVTSKLSDSLAKNSPSGFPAGEMTCEFAGSNWQLKFEDGKKVTLFRDGKVAVVSTYQLRENQIRYSDITGPMASKEPGVEIDTYVQELEHIDRAILEGTDEGFVKIHTKREPTRSLEQPSLPRTRAT